MLLKKAAGRVLSEMRASKIQRGGFSPKCSAVKSDGTGFAEILGSKVRRSGFSPKYAAAKSGDRMETRVFL
jgi:hypothetical protein